MWAQGEWGREICHPGRALGGLRRILTLDGLFVFLKSLLTVGKAFSWALRTNGQETCTEPEMHAWAITDGVDRLVTGYATRPSARPFDYGTFELLVIFRPLLLSNTRGSWNGWC